MTILPDGLQVLIISHGSDAARGERPNPLTYVETIRQAFLGGDPSERGGMYYFSAGNASGASVQVFLVDSNDATAPSVPKPSSLDKALHTLVVILATPNFIADAAAVGAVRELAEASQASNGRHIVLLLAASEESQLVFSRAMGSEAASCLKGRSLESLGEYALRPSYAALLCLSKARELLSSGLSTEGKGPARAKFFISHAKLDGLPLAQAFRHTLEVHPWLDRFYDADDIQPGDDFRQILKMGVCDSMVVALRTNIYDERFWCRQEIMWAERYNRPLLLVEARTELVSRPSPLGFAGVPLVRVPDGNLVRVLGEALREWVRIGIFDRRLRELLERDSGLRKRVRSLCRPPTATSLAAAIDALAVDNDEDTAVRVVHPDPALETDFAEAVRHMIHARFQDGEILPLKTFLAKLP